MARHLVIFGSCQDIYYWWSCRFGFTLNTAMFRWHCFQINNPLPKLEHLVLVPVYLEILNACKIIVVIIAIWLYIHTQTFQHKSFSGTIFLGYKSNSNSFFYELNWFLICFQWKPIRFYEQTTLIWSSVLHYSIPFFGGLNENYYNTYMHLVYGSYELHEAQSLSLINSKSKPLFNNGD